MQNVLESARKFYNLKLNQKLPSFKRYIFEDILHSIANLTAIYGSRGVGKTTLLMQVLKEFKLPKNRMLYISCDYPYEIGGKNKSFTQIADMPNSYVVADDIEVGFGNKVPLWLFGFLY